MKKTPKKKKNNYPHNPYLIGYKAPDGTVYGYTYNRTIQKYEFSKTHISTHFNIGETQAFTFRQAIDLSKGRGRRDSVNLPPNMRGGRVFLTTLQDQRCEFVCSPFVDQWTSLSFTLKDQKVVA